MSELIFFILGIGIGGIAGSIYGALYMTNYIVSKLPSEEELKEFKREIDTANSNAKATTQAMH